MTITMQLGRTVGYFAHSLVGLPRTFLANVSQKYYKGQPRR